MATPLDTRIKPPIWTAALGLTQWLLAGRPSLRKRPGRVRFLAAGIAGTVTAAVGITALAQFSRHETTFDPETPELASALVTDGIYGYTRNPMYLALTGALVTHAVWLGSLRAIPPVAALAVVLTAFQIRPEERALEQIFGDEYRDYMNQVPRWLGWPSEGKTSPGV